MPQHSFYWVNGLLPNHFLSNERAFIFPLSLATSYQPMRYVGCRKGTRPRTDAQQKWSCDFQLVAS